MEKWNRGQEVIIYKNEEYIHFYKTSVKNQKEDLLEIGYEEDFPLEPEQIINLDILGKNAIKTYKGSVQKLASPNVLIKIIKDRDITRNALSIDLISSIILIRWGEDKKGERAMLTELSPSYATLTSTQQFYPGQRVKLLEVKLGSHMVTDIFGRVIKIQPPEEYEEEQTITIEFLSLPEATHDKIVQFINQKQIQTRKRNE
jgi:hypothetical protein